MCQEFVEILGEGVVVVPGCRLAGLAESPAVVGDNTAPGSKEHRNLLLPGGSAQRISVDEDDRVTRAVIFVIEFNVGGVFVRDINVWHLRFSLFLNLLLGCVAG